MGCRALRGTWLCQQRGASHREPERSCRSAQSTHQPGTPHPKQSMIRLWKTCKSKGVALHLLAGPSRPWNGLRRSAAAGGGSPPLVCRRSTVSWFWAAVGPGPAQTSLSPLMKAYNVPDSQSQVVRGRPASEMRGTLGSRPLFPACLPSLRLWELGLLCDDAMSLSIDEPAASRLFVVAGRSTSVSEAACAAA